MMLGRRTHRGKGSPWDVGRIVQRDSLALGIGDYITFTCQVREPLQRKAANLVVEKKIKAFPRIQLWDAQERSQGPAWLPPPLVDLLVGEVGSGAGQPPFTGTVKSWQPLSCLVSMSPYQSLMPMHDVQ